MLAEGFFASVASGQRQRLAENRGEGTDGPAKVWLGCECAANGVLMGWDGMLFGERDTVSCLGEQERRVCVCVYESRSAVPRLLRWEEAAGPVNSSRH